MPYSYEDRMKRLHAIPGPWKDEPDRLEWRCLGFPCLIVRNNSGSLCGYVGVPPSHPWHGKQYDDVDVEVHGGLTYSRPCEEGGNICHTPRPGEAEVYWLGFDCAHAGDLSPLLNAHLAARPFPAAVLSLGNALSGPSSLGEKYRDITYVTAEVERLAKQAAEAK